MISHLNAIFGIVVLIILALLAILSFYKNGKGIGNVCRTDECKYAVKRCVGNFVAFHLQTSSNSLVSGRVHGRANLILQNMDASVNACDDLYLLACGGMLKKDLEGKDVLSADVEKKNAVNNHLQSILSETSKANTPTPYKKARHLFKLCMDESAIDTRGISPIVALFEKVGGWPILGGWKNENWNWLKAKVELHSLGVAENSLINIQHEMKGNKTALVVKPPSRSPLSKKFIEDFVSKFDIMIDEEADKHIDEMINFQSKLLAYQRKPNAKRFYTYKVEQLKEKASWLDWRLILDAFSSPDPLRQDNDIIIMDEGYLDYLKDLLDQTPNAVLADYVLLNVAVSLADILPKRIRLMKYQLLLDNGYLSIHLHTTRLQECIAMVRNLNLVIGSMYVSKYFDHTSREQVKEMVQTIQDTFKADVNEVDWLDNYTRELALKKVKKIRHIISHPKELMNITKLEQHYKDLNLNEEHYFEAVLDLNKWLRKFRIVTDEGWKEFSDQVEIGANYHSESNTIEIPTVMLELPYFRPKLPSYLNFGSLGFMIGHELTHALDPKGSEYDADGNKRKWLDDTSRKLLKDKTTCLKEQYSKFWDEVGKLNVNGKQTLNENIADGGGLKLSFGAYQKLASTKGKSEQSLPGLEQYNNKQMFFIGMASIWCRKTTYKFAIQKLLYDNYSPNHFRVNGATMNLPEFGEVFGCNQDTPMNPKNKCKIW